MRGYFRISAFLILTLLVAGAATAQVRGRGRLQGIVTDKNTGKPVEGAVVTVVLATESTTPIVTKTDARGRWSALGLTNGQWNIDIVAKGYETTRGSANVSEIQMLPTIKTEIVPEQKQEAAPVAPSPLIPKEAVQAITEGQDLLRAPAPSDDVARENVKHAIADFEKALPLIPTDKPEAKEIQTQLMQVMAQAYYKGGDLPKAISMLEQLNVSDPWTAADAGQTPREILLANLYLEHGDLDKGKALIEKLPASAITDPTVYVNIGILFLNKKNPAEGATYFTRAIELDPKRAEAYYYRGLALLQQRKNREAKPDLEQVLALAPNSDEARDAKQLLAGIK